MIKPIYIQVRPLDPGEVVSYTEDYGSEGVLKIERAADGSIIGMEILVYKQVTIGGKLLSLGESNGGAKDTE